VKARHGSRIGKIFADGRQVDEALRLAARDAIRKHALHDAPIVVWRDGRIAWVPARELTSKTSQKAMRTGKRSSKRGR
jgi:hypothetical protein